MPPPHPSPRILAIETSSAHGSVALAEGDDLRAVADLATTAKHCQHLMPTIDALCRQSGWKPTDLDHIYVSAGPGSFTGLRISITIAKTLATALGLQIVAVPTMRVIAARAESLDEPPASLGVVLDAKRQQVYASLFQLRDRQYEMVLDACLMTPAELLERAPRPLSLTGEGLAWHADAFQEHAIDWLDEDHRMPRAQEVHRIGRRMAKQSEFTPPNELIPIYIRVPEAEEKWAERQGLAPPS
jgi:tRNA threonylcarbamoyladenosine biosynthesis protein TsaB